MSSEVSREKPTDYAEMARVLVDERERGGHVIWVVGPAVLHSRGRDTLAWFVENGFVGVLFGGNAVAVHDIESATHGHHARHGRPRQPGGGRPRLPHARHQPRPRRRLDPRPRWSRASSSTASCTRWSRTTCRSCSAAPSATTGRCRTPSPTRSLAQEAMKEHTRRDRRDHDRHRAARHRDRQHAALLRLRRADAARSGRSRRSASTRPSSSSRSSRTAARTRPSASSPTPRTSCTCCASTWRRGRGAQVRRGLSAAAPNAALAAALAALPAGALRDRRDRPRLDLRPACGRVRQRAASPCSRCSTTDARAPPHRHRAGTCGAANRGRHAPR
jgi:hypothetical protein